MIQDLTRKVGESCKTMKVGRTMLSAYLYSYARFSLKPCVQHTHGYASSYWIFSW